MKNALSIFGQIFSKILPFPSSFLRFPPALVVVPGRSRRSGLPCCGLAFRALPRAQIRREEGDAFVRRCRFSRAICAFFQVSQLYLTLLLLSSFLSAGTGKQIIMHHGEQVFLHQYHGAVAQVCPYGQCSVLCVQLPPGLLPSAASLSSHAGPSRPLALSPPCSSAFYPSALRAVVERSASDADDSLCRGIFM